MVKSIILLAPDDTHEPIAVFLRSENPSLDIIPITSLPALLAIPAATLAISRLIAFTSPIIVPTAILDALGFGAYNFHPAPPSYPGLSPAAYAIYDGARIYGATVHRMVEKVDAGPIVAAEFCLIDDEAGVADIELQSFTLLAKLFRELAARLATDPAPLPTLPIAWSSNKSSRRSLQTICDIPLDIEAEELARRVKAFANNHFGIQPSVSLHGYVFRLVHETPAADSAPALPPQPVVRVEPAATIGRSPVYATERYAARSKGGEAAGPASHPAAVGQVSASR